MTTLTSPRWLWPAMLTLTLACAQSVGDVVRVQPNVLRKADLLDGQWFFRNTVTWTPFNTQFTYPGQTGAIEKLVWEIQESYLVGYRAYPYSLGTDPSVDPTSTVSGTTMKWCDAKGTCTGGHPYFGAPVVAFPVVSHFDIQRGYNPATSEQTNVIAENTTDRPWNEREYFRVNWSANVLNKMSGMNFGTVQNASGHSTNSNWIEPNEPGSDPYDWPTFEYEDRNADGKAELTYFDVTGRYTANPDMTYIRGYGSVPSCWFRHGIHDCSSSEIHVRISVSKIDTTWAQDYEPLQYGNDLMALFGYFRTQRLNWDKKFGYDESAVVRLAQRHRVWKEYFQKDASGAVTAQPIPLASREPKPIVYYFTPAERMGGQDRYDEFWEPGRRLEAGFDHAFRRAIAAAKGTSIEQVPQMFYLCNNPVKAGDPHACGVTGLKPKVGDLRYSFVNTVAEPVANGLLGYGPSSADPETGQILSGMSNTYTWGVDEYGRRVTDWILVLSGEKSIDDYLSGQSVKDFINRNPAYNLAKYDAQVAALQSELQGTPTRTGEATGVWDRPTPRMTQLAGAVAANRAVIQAGADQLQVAADTLAQNPTLEAAVLDNPDTQADLLNLLPPFAQAAAQTDPAFLRQAARTVLTNIQLSQDYEKSRVEWLSNNNVTTFDFTDRTLVALALQKMGTRAARITALEASGAPSCANPASCTAQEATSLATDEVAKQVRQQVWLATALHETGHTLDLQHNFQGSYDAINYFDDYWDLRKSTITVLQNGQKKLPRTPADLKAAANGTEAQQLSGIHDHEYSSVMDYSGKITANWNGLGKYDEAAILFAYSGDSAPGYVEVFDAARATSMAFPGSDGTSMTITGAAVDLPLVNATHTNPNVRNYTERYHYTTVPLHLGEGSDLATVLDDGILKLRSRSLARYSDVLKDEDKVRAAMALDPTLAADPVRAAAVTGPTLLRVPYMFCNDESADGPILSCNRFDRGPDYYEIVRTKLEDYWNYYIDNHFRRDSAFFSGSSALNRTFRTFEFVSDVYKHWTFEYLKNATRNQEQVPTIKLDPLLQDYWTIAVLDGVNQHLNVMSVPPDGLYMYRNLRGVVPRWDVIDQGSDFDYLNPLGRQAVSDLYTRQLGGLDYVVLPRGLGRRMYSRYDFKSGYNFFTRMLEAGHYNDQVGAMFAAVDSRIELQGVDLAADHDRYTIPYYLVFRQELQDTFGALWSQDEDKIRPTLYKTIDNANQIEDNANLFWRVYVKGSDLFTGFDYPPLLPPACIGANTPGGTNPPRCFLPDQKAAPANIQLTWTSRIYGLYLGMSMFRANFDLDYAKANQICKLGSGEAFTVTPGFHTLEVQDPTDGHRYLAIERDGAAPNSTAAVKMINISRDYLTMVNDPTTCPLPDFLYFQSYSCMSPTAATNAALVADRKRFWLEVFHNEIRDLDLQRGMYSHFGKAF